MVKNVREEEFHQFLVEQFAVLNGRITGLHNEVREGFNATEQRIDDVLAIVEPLSEAFDRDAETVIEHDRRLSRIEKKLDLGSSK